MIVSAVDKFSRKLRVSSFIVSFIILGLLTSTPEFAVGLRSVAENDPEIFIGNLIGGIPVIFFFVLPVLAILGNGIKTNGNLPKYKLLFSLFVFLAPSILILDKKVTNSEGFIMIGLYLALVVFLQFGRGIFNGDKTKVLNAKAYSYKDLIKILIGIGIVFVTSNFIVENTIYFSQILNVPLFFISLIVLSFGTNIPEISLAVRSALSRKKDVAFGDYMGSAAANTFLFGILTILNNGEALTDTDFTPTFIFIALGLSVFYYFTRSKSSISRKEGFILLGIYIIFIAFIFNRQ